MRFFSLMAASVGLSPTDPDTAVTTQSAAFSVAASMSPSIPLPTRISVSASRVFRSFAAFSSNIATNLGFNSLACCSTRSVFLFAVNATTGTPKCFAAAMLWRPIEPVEPRMDTALITVLHLRNGGRGCYTLRSPCPIPAE